MLQNLKIQILNINNFTLNAKFTFGSIQKQMAVDGVAWDHQMPCPFWLHKQKMMIFVQQKKFLCSELGAQNKPHFVQHKKNEAERYTFCLL